VTQPTRKDRFLDPLNDHLVPQRLDRNHDLVKAHRPARTKFGQVQLKWWRVLATELRCRPSRCTRMIKAVLTVYHREHTPFAA